MTKCSNIEFQMKGKQRTQVGNSRMKCNLLVEPKPISKSLVNYPTVNISF